MQCLGGSFTTTRVPRLPTPSIEQSYDYCFMSCSHFKAERQEFCIAYLHWSSLAYLMTDGLGNMKITVVAGAATLIAVIFWVLREQHPLGTQNTESHSQGTTAIRRTPCIFSMNTKHSQIGGREEGR